MTRQDVELIKQALCPHDEDYDLPCISPHNLELVLEELLLQQQPRKTRKRLRSTSMSEDTKKQIKLNHEREIKSNEYAKKHIKR